jgi:hypothetical protein
MTHLAGSGRMVVKSAKSRRPFGDCRANTENAAVRKRNKTIVHVTTSGWRKIMKVGQSTRGTGPKYNGTPWPGLAVRQHPGSKHDVSRLT